MAFDTFSDLKSEITKWMLDRSDLSPEVEGFIKLCEADMNKILRTSYQEVANHEITSGSFTDGVAALPSDFLEARSVRGGSSSINPLKGVSPDAFATLNPTLRNGVPLYFTIKGAEIFVAPGPSTSVFMDYYAKLTPLSDVDPSNWVLANAPFAYLSGSCRYAARYLRNKADEDSFGADFLAQMNILSEQDSLRRWGNMVSNRVSGGVRP